MVELAEIFQRYGPAYQAKYGEHMLPSHRRAMRDIERCRTPALGGHVYTCPDCGQTEYLYHSCRNRHCPKCQNDKAQRWLEAQQALLLPVRYFLLTFTLPEELRAIARSHQRLVYDLLFRVSAEAIQQLGQAKRWVGGQIGMMGVLHTLRQAQGRRGAATWPTTRTCITWFRAAAWGGMGCGVRRGPTSCCRSKRYPG